MKPENLERIRENAEAVSSLMKTLSHPNRLMIVCDLIGTEKAVSDIEASSGVKQPVLSRELARLRDEGLVSTRRESKAVFYRITDAQLVRLMDVLCSAWNGSPVPAGAAADQPTAKPQTKTGAALAPPSGRARSRVRLKPDPYRTQ